MGSLIDITFQEQTANVSKMSASTYVARAFVRECHCLKEKIIEDYDERADNENKNIMIHFPRSHLNKTSIHSNDPLDYKRTLTHLAQTHAHRGYLFFIFYFLYLLK